MKAPSKAKGICSRFYMGHAHQQSPSGTSEIFRMQKNAEQILCGVKIKLYYNFL